MIEINTKKEKEYSSKIIWIALPKTANIPKK
jgi:hypothetical protein